MELTMEPGKISSLDRGRESLEKTFGAYLKSEVRVERPNVLSVGCGAGYEAEPILQLFPSAKYKDIDISGSNIRLARRTNSDLPEDIFQVADAKSRDSFAGGPWDIIILRNPQITETLEGLTDFLEGKAKVGKDWELNIRNGKKVSKDWALIIKNSIDFLKKDGILLVTTPSGDERVIILDQLKTPGKELEILVNEDNKHKAASGVFDDDIVILAKKTADNI